MPCLYVCCLPVHSKTGCRRHKKNSQDEESTRTDTEASLLLRCTQKGEDGVRIVQANAAQRDEIIQVIDDVIANLTYSERSSSVEGSVAQLKALQNSWRDEKQKPAHRSRRPKAPAKISKRLEDMDGGCEGLQDIDWLRRGMRGEEAQHAARQREIRWVPPPPPPPSPAAYQVTRFGCPNKTPTKHTYNIYITVVGKHESGLKCPPCTSHPT